MSSAWHIEWNVNDFSELGSPKRWMKFCAAAKIQFQDSFFLFIFWFPPFLVYKPQKSKLKKKKKIEKEARKRKTYEHFEFLSWQFSDGFNFKHVLIQFVVISKIYIVCLCLCVFCAFGYEFGSSTLFIDLSHSFDLFLSSLRDCSLALDPCVFFSFIFHSKTLPSTQIHTHNHIYFQQHIPTYKMRRYQSFCPEDSIQNSIYILF